MWYARTILTGYFIYLFVRSIFKINGDRNDKYFGDIAKIIGAVIGSAVYYGLIFYLLYIGGFYKGM